MTFLYIVLGIVAFIALILFTNIRFKIEYDGKLDIKFYFGIFKIPEGLIKTASKKEKKQKKTDKSEKKNTEKTKKESKFLKKIKNKGICDSFNILMDFLKPSFKVLLSFASKITVNPLIIKIKIVGDDAAKTAIDYGKFCALYYPALNMFTSKVNCKKLDSNVFVSYTDKNSEVYLKTQIKIRLIHCLTHAISIIVEFFRLKNKFE